MRTRLATCAWVAICCFVSSAVAFTAPRGHVSALVPRRTCVSAAVAAGAALPRARRHVRQPPAGLRMDAAEAFRSYLSIPDESVLKAVEKGGNRVAAQDVAALAGIDLGKARLGLQNLASLTGGDLEVTSSGDIIYNFPRDFRTVLSSRSAAVRSRETLNKVWPYLFYGIRVGFGVFLVVSIIVIFTAIAFISVAGTSSNDDDRRRDSRSSSSSSMMFSPRLYFGPSPFDFFYYRPYYGYYSTPSSQRQDPNEMGFFESTFSYIFGDGNPNADIESRRLSTIAQMVRQNGNAVTAEQLAPYLDPPAPQLSRDSPVVDESFVLPAVTALRGEPRVTDSGDIIYVFPELQTTAAAAEGYERRAGWWRSSPPPVEPALQEEAIQFSVAGQFNKILAGFLGFVNLGGALYLQGLLREAAAAGITFAGYYGAVQAAMPLLLGYAVLFNAIPLTRWFLNSRENAEIEKRNAARTAWAALLSSGNTNITRKLAEARTMATKLKVLSSSDVAYTTAKDIGEQREELLSPLDDFDRRLG